MPNNFGALNDTPILHDFFVEFWGELLAVSDFVLDVQDPISGEQNAKPGDTIRIKNWKQDYTTYNVNPATGYVVQGGAQPSTLPFVLPSQVVATSENLTAEEFRLLASGRAKGADYEAFKRKVQNGMLFALGRAIVTAMLAPVTKANFPNEIVVASGTFSRNTETRIEEKFFDRKVPLESPQMVLKSDAFREWTDDHQAIVNNTGERVQKPLLMSGRRPSTVTPFTLQRTHVALPPQAGRGFASTRTALIGAIRTPDEATFDRDPVSLSHIVEPRTGAAILARLWKNAGTGAIQMDFAAIFKFEPGQPEALERIVAVATP